MIDNKVHLLFVNVTDGTFCFGKGWDSISLVRNLIYCDILRVHNLSAVPIRGIIASKGNLTSLRRTPFHAPRSRHIWNLINVGSSRLREEGVTNALRLLLQS